jgi:hypothetical protein
MKRRSSSGKKSGTKQSHSLRLIDKPPIAYLGPGAFAALANGCGLLLGSQRRGWVDLVAYEPHPEASCKELVDRRFADRGERPDLDVVGIVLAKTKLERRHDFLVRELVPGDVILALTGERNKPQVYVHLGDRWEPARLKMSRAGAATSARSGHR